jgi:hypothetical protein
MVSFRSKQAKSVAEIHLSPNVDHTLTSQPNVWLSNEDIKGSAIFRLPPGVEFSHSKITLRGEWVVVSNVNAIYTDCL